MKQNERLLIVSRVDDLIIAADKVISLSNVKKMLMSEFKMKDLGKLNHFIGIDFHTTQESLYLIQLLNGMGPQQRYEPAKILGDNQGATALSKVPVNRQKCKHIDIKHHFIRDENRGYLLSNHRYDCGHNDKTHDKIKAREIQKTFIWTLNSFWIVLSYVWK